MKITINVERLVRGHKVSGTMHIAGAGQDPTPIGEGYCEKYKQIPQCIKDLVAPQFNQDSQS